MKILIDYGLKNPSIKSLRITTADGKKVSDEFRLCCDNFNENILMAKKFSFFEQMFNSFLIEKHESLYDQLKNVIFPEEEKRENEEGEESARLILEFLESQFENYLEEKKVYWEEEYTVKVKMPYSFKWFKATSFTTILPNDEDIENKYLILCLIPKSLQEYLKRGSKEIETRVVNVLYKEKLFHTVPNIYYRYVDKNMLDGISINKKVKQHIEKENAVIYAISTNVNQQNKKQNVYLYNFLLKGEKK